MKTIALFRTRSRFNRRKRRPERESLCSLPFNSRIRALATALLLAGATALADVHYVDANSTNATSPYTNWATAAAKIQDAVDVAVAGDEVVVTNGAYAAGGRTIDGVTTNRVAVDKPLSIRSVNGPQFTTIGGGLVRCVYLTDNANLSGFTVAGGYINPASGATSAAVGAGVLCAPTALVSNCWVLGNQIYQSIIRVGTFPGGVGGGAYGGTLVNCTLADNLAGDGGGAAYCTLIDCTLSNNKAAVYDDYCGCVLTADGGGAYHCMLNNCTLIGNSASADMTKSYNWDDVYSDGGGAAYCTLNNCTLTRNQATILLRTGLFTAGAGEGAFYSTLNNCIVYTTGYVLQNETASSLLNYCWLADPLFADEANGDLRLQSNSPCINAGNNASAPAGPDLDGNPRRGRHGGHRRV